MTKIEINPNEESKLELIITREKMKIVKYLVIRSGCMDDLENEVIESIEQGGWEPYGSLVATCSKGVDYFYQPIVVRESNDE